MIRKFKEDDIEKIMEIWLNTNIDTHNFIPRDYWENNFDIVKNMLPEATIYVYDNNKIKGFIGIIDNYIAGIFVNNDEQSNGIGKKLLDYAKQFTNKLTLQVYEKNIRAVKFYEREDFIIKNKQIDENTGELEFLMIWEK